jgi:hypothetical protein
MPSCLRVVVELARLAGSSASVLGLVVIKWMRASFGSVSKVFFWRPFSLFRLVHDWPDAGTYWRGSCGLY